jgi:chemotaxis protein methyltransferase CheR
MNMGTPEHTSLLLSDELFEQLRQLIYHKTGIYFQDNKRYFLEARLGKRLEECGFSDFRSYFDALSRRNNAQEMTTCVNNVTINETFFFRAAKHFELVERHLLPALISERLKQGKTTIRLWSAGCSTGEEAYTLALILQDRFRPRYPQLRFELVATDINTEVLARAEEGTYSAYAVRHVPPALLSKYFNRTDEHKYALDTDVKQLVRFRRVNLFDRTEMLGVGLVDLVFCANVLLDFDSHSKTQAVSSLYRALNPGGVLFLGFSENLYGIEHGFMTVRNDGILHYRKPS